MRLSGQHWKFLARALFGVGLGTALLAATIRVPLVIAAAQAPISAVQPRAPRRFTVVARRYEFTPSRIEVTEGDVVKITLQAADIPHSFTIDEYRISKRATPDRPIQFEFRAGQPGTFPFYCHLKIDDRCRTMRGELVVRAR